MSFILPNWIPRDPTLLEGCINEEMKRLAELQEEISKIEAKPTNPFVFKNPSPDTKLPCSMTMKLLNTLIYKANIVDYDYSYDIRAQLNPTIYIATEHEIHTFQVPIYKNNPIIKVPDPNIEIRSIAIFPDSIIALFTNDIVLPYSLVESSWISPINVPFKQEINIMKRIKNYLFFQTGTNKISIFDSLSYQLIKDKNLDTKAILECYFPTDSNKGFFKTIEKDVIVVDIESLRVILTVSLSDIFLCKLAIQSYGNYVFAYNDEATIKYNQNFKIEGQFEFGSSYMCAEYGLIFFLSETSQKELLNEKDSPNQNSSNDQENFSEEEDNDVNISLSIATIQTGEVLAVLSITHLNISSFKVIFTKLGERCIIIKCDDNSLSFWNFTFEVPQKDEHGRVVLQRMEEENQKGQQPQGQQQQQQQQLLFKPSISKTNSNPVPPQLNSMRSMMSSSQALTVINAPKMPVNQATSAHLVGDPMNSTVPQPQVNLLTSSNIQRTVSQPVRRPNMITRQIISNPNTTINDNPKFSQNPSPVIPVTNSIQQMQIISNVNVSPSHSGNDNIRQAHTHKFAPKLLPQGANTRKIQPILQQSKQIQSQTPAQLSQQMQQQNLPTENK